MRDIELIYNDLNPLYRELDRVQAMGEEAVIHNFHVGSKKECIDIINDEIDALENELEEAERWRDRDINYEATEDKPYICW